MPEPIKSMQDLNAWRRAIASVDGPEASTRLVLLVLSLRMDRTGFCCPKIPTVAVEAGLTERATGKHLAAAAKAGWLDRKRGAGRLRRQWVYQATMPVTPEPRSGERGSGEPRSGERRSKDTGTTFGSHPHTELVKELEEATPEPRSGVAQADVPRNAWFGPPGSTGPHVPDSVAPERRTQSPSVDPRRAGDAGHSTTPERPAEGPSGGFLGVSDLVMALRDAYPHPANGGAPQVVPGPLAVEGWIGDMIRVGKLDVQELPAVLAGAKAAARASEKHPEVYRRTLRTWIREAGWQETVADEGGIPVPPPPKRDGPRFTPRDWSSRGIQLNAKETHERDDGEQA